MAALFSPAPAAATPISTGHASAFESFRLRLPRASPVSPRADDLSGECDQEHATRRLRSLAAQEPAYAPNADYIETVQTRGMTDAWRAKIASWFRELGEAFDMRSETVAIATNYLDRYLSRRSCESVDLQLAATASIFLASKVEEQRHFRTGDLVSLCGGLFSRADLRLMELELMMTLGWLLNPPTIHSNVHHLVALVDSDSRDRRSLVDRALKYADKAREDYAMLRYPPSLAAVAAVVCALRTLDAPFEETAKFVDRVNALKLPYQLLPDAARSLQACGLRFLAEADDLEEDQEVSSIAQQDHPLLTGANDSDHEHAPSPTDVFATEAYEGSPKKKQRVA